MHICYKCTYNSYIAIAISYREVGWKTGRGQLASDICVLCVQYEARSLKACTADGGKVTAMDGDHAMHGMIQHWMMNNANNSIEKSV